MRAVKLDLKTGIENLENIVKGAIGFITLNNKLLGGFALLISITLVSWIGLFLSPYDPVVMGNVPRDLPPSLKHPLGTTSLGRDILTQLFFGTLRSMEIGFMAGILSFAIALFVAFIGAYYGGMLDGALTILTEVFITIPSLAILIIIASLVRVVTIPLMALILTIFSWAWPAKVIRSQVLSLKERGFVELARLSGMRGIEIILKEIMPNILSYLGAYFAVVVSGAMVAEVGLEVIGLGPRHTITLGMILHWAISHSAIVRGLFWWWVPPCIMLLLIFLALFFISTGLDEIGNPRLKEI